MTNKEQILSVAQAYHDMVAEASLVGNQKKLDVNDNDKIDAADLAALRAGAKANEAAQEPEAPAADEPQPTAEVPQAQAPEAPAPAPAPEAPDAEKQDDDEEELDESSKKAWHATLVRHGVMSRGEFMKTWAKKGPGLSDAERAERGRAGRERVAAYANKQKTVTNEAHDLATESVEDTSSSANQWENDHAHSTAASWSMHARHEPTFANHSRAAEAHKIAAAKYAAKNNKEMEQHHSSSSSYHAAKAAEIMDRDLQKAAVTNEETISEENDIASYHKKLKGMKTDEWSKTMNKHIAKKAQTGFTRHAAEHEILRQKFGKDAHKKYTSGLKEALDPKADAGEWISDFVHSTDPKFDGKSKEERTQQALAAYYQARRDAGLKEEVMTEATASELSKQAHALSRSAESPADHKKAASAHYKAATALRRHTTANAAKTGPKADAAHTAALEHEKLADKHYGKSMVEESAIKVSIQKPMSEYERFKDDLKYHERMYGTRDYTGDKERDDRYAGMKKKLETLRAQHLASLKKESAETIGENYGFNVHATNLTTTANQASALAHSTPAEAGALKAHDDATRAHQEAADHYGVVAQHATDPQQKRVAQIHHQFHSDMATHHTLHGVTLSMDEQTVNEAKSCEEEVGTTEADWDAHYCAQTPEMQEAITRGKNVGLRYPEAYKVARNVVRKEGTEEPRAEGEKDFKNMHDDNIEISGDPAASGSVTGADKVTQAEKPSTPNNPPVMDVKSLKSVAEAYVNMLNKG